jgi:hypothetical protein
VELAACQWPGQRWCRRESVGQAFALVGSGRNRFLRGDGLWCVKAFGAPAAEVRKAVLQAPTHAEADVVGWQLCCGSLMGSARAEGGGASEAEEPHDADVASAVLAALAQRSRRRHAAGRIEHEGFFCVERGQPAGAVEGIAGVGAHESVVADFLEAAWQDVLQDTSQELFGLEGRRPGPSRSALAPGEGDMVVVRGADAVVTDSDAEDVGSQIADGGPAVADSLEVDDPVLLPCRRVDFAEETGLLHGAAELAAEKYGERLFRHEEVRAYRNALGPFSRDALLDQSSGSPRIASRSH